jgi:hypothetical protein
LPEENIPVATTLAAAYKQRSQQRWLLPLWVLMAIGFLVSGLREPGPWRWVSFGLCAGWVFLILLPSRAAAVIREHEGQRIPNVEDQRDDVSS